MLNKTYDLLTPKPTCPNDVNEEQFIPRLSQGVTKTISNNLRQNIYIFRTVYL